VKGCSLYTLPGERYFCKTELSLNIKIPLFPILRKEKLLRSLPRREDND
jgi:hypothetical protein